ncbi:glycosyltransferase family 4 protein [Candidatus Nitrosacidococcus tergens]|uniref:Glycosyl transferase group 1 n=1 Tax=Candidatus Nitrosacidococcus tergens TaxID=553981 RepID=A0A7G1Q8B8_9GAMM|nr:glycosyltransferase family 4 protein [Candidatus Nitrosacidococcus tergens]CAB1275132.1 Glycosyl transferase group 1 [Candidatus Nitrosacidococcus tergens]
MKVLHFYKTYFPETIGGVEQVIYQIARGVSTYGIDTKVLTLAQEPSKKPLVLENHLIYQTKRDFQMASTGFSRAALFHFIELVERVDIIHYHFPWPFMDIVHFLSSVKKPTVLTYHSDIIRQRFLLTIYRPLMEFFLNHVDVIVTTSPNYLATSQVLNRYRDKTEVIPIGIDKNTYPQITSSKLNYWRNWVGEGFFLFVGMLRYYKGLHILLDAIKDTNFSVVIVGSGPIEHSLKHYAKSLKLRNIYFLGTLSDEDKVALIQLSLAIVFPSHLRSEAFGISLLEGAMYGKPMISSEIGTGTSYINIHNETGLIVPPSDSIAFRKAMEFLWNHSDIAKKMGERAEARYWQLFTGQHMARSYAHLYQRLRPS